MASVIEFDLSGGQAAAKAVVQAAATAQGYTPESTGDWSAFLVRGSNAKVAAAGRDGGQRLLPQVRALLFADMTPHVAMMTGRKVLSIISKDAGRLVNPGSEEFSFVIPPVAAESMRKEFGV